MCGNQYIIVVDRPWKWELGNKGSTLALPLTHCNIWQIVYLFWTSVSPLSNDSRPKSFHRGLSSSYVLLFSTSKLYNNVAYNPLQAMVLLLLVGISQPLITVINNDYLVSLIRIYISSSNFLWKCLLSKSVADSKIGGWFWLLFAIFFWESGTHFLNLTLYVYQNTRRMSEKFYFKMRWKKIPCRRLIENPSTWAPSA